MQQISTRAAQFLLFTNSQSSGSRPSGLKASYPEWLRWCYHWFKVARFTFPHSDGTIRGQLTHHGGSPVANDIGALIEGAGVHDAGRGDAQGHHVESQQQAEIEQHHHHLEHWAEEDENTAAEGQGPFWAMCAFSSLARVGSED